MTSEVILESIELARSIVDILEEKKGEDIVLLDIHEVAIFADFFVICSGTSERMLGALLEAVVDKVRENHHLRPHIEGLPEDGWILVDYGDVILHVFSPRQREYYNLEALWAQARVLLHVQ